MSKDPAFLFYSSDFLTGTMTMTHEQVGKYIRLLCLQHQRHELSEIDMRFVCGTYDEAVYSKFTKTETGYFNERLRFEAERRANFCNSRRNNVAGKSENTTKEHTKRIRKPYDKHMENENEDVNVNKKANKKFTPPTIEDVILYFKENGYLEEYAKKVFNYYSVADWTDSRGNKVKNWKQKLNANWFKDENKISPEMSIQKIKEQEKLRSIQHKEFFNLPD